MKPTYNELVLALRRAVDVCNYVSMTRYEREVTLADREAAESMLARAAGPTEEEKLSEALFEVELLKNTVHDLSQRIAFLED